MKQNHTDNRRKGFTLIELVVVIATVSIMTLGVGVLLANSQKSFGSLFGRVYSDSTINSFSAQQAFDAVCRKASLRRHVLSESGDSLELYYWDNTSTASVPENYAHFYQLGDGLFVEYGKTRDGAWQPDTETDPTSLQIGHDVDSVKFSLEGTAVRMHLNYTDAAVLPVACSSVRRNE
ncbi:MAG: prepilin-type N-terminal cleavage/methylation domain-containing protein [Planctomycetota bacterium]